MFFSSTSKGKKGEEIAATFLKKDGYKIIEKNYRSPFGEIDLIAREKKDIVFVEVKLRNSENYGGPLEAVGRTKQRRIVKTALHYIKHKRLENSSFRFDVIAVGPENIVEVIKSAFGPDRAYTL
jgi:putative endonuclease